MARRFLMTVAALWVAAAQALAALSTATIWEVRTTGSDTNGGGWTAGSTGTDWTKQDAAQYSVTDGVTAGTTTITSATASFGTDVVGNVMYVAGGTGSVTAGWYQITARASSTSITVDRSTGLTAGTGVTLKIGGALATLSALNAVMIGSNKAYVKGSGFTSTAGINFTQSAVPNGSTAGTRIIGYTSTRGDGGRFTLTLQTTSGLTGLKATGSGIYFENCAVNCSSLGTSTGIELVGAYGRAVNCKVSNFTFKGIKVTGVNGTYAAECEVTGGTSAATCGIDPVGAAYVAYNWVHDNACPGIILTASSSIICFSNLVTNNTGASSDGIQCAYGNSVVGNTCHGNGRDGIRNIGPHSICNRWLNNILTSNAGYGITGSNSTANPAEATTDGNAFWNNTSGTRNLMDSTVGIFGTDGYTNTRDIILTGNPYISSAGNDFSLNSTAGAGAACRGSAVPGLFSGSSSTSAGDMGAVQATSSGGGSAAGTVKKSRIQLGQ